MVSYSLIHFLTLERMSDHANNLADCVLEELETKKQIKIFYRIFCKK